MKKILVISYWIASVILQAVVLVSMGYRFAEAIFISSLLLPGSLASKFIIPKASHNDKATDIKNTFFAILGILTIEFLLINLSHLSISVMREGMYDINGFTNLPNILANPVFVAAMITIVSVGNYYFEHLLQKKYPSERKSVTFLSDRKAVTLNIEDILYIESNNTITTVFAKEDRQFRNKTLISQWESILGDDFIRIHRSYLVNMHLISGMEDDMVIVCDNELPVSRKYMKDVKEVIEIHRRK